MNFSVYQASHAIPLNGADYLIFLQELIKRARKRVWLAMFFINPYPLDDEDENVKNLLKLLTKGYKRGCDIKILIEKAPDTPPINIANQLTYMLLKSNNVPIRYYDGRRNSMHNKYLIVDNNKLILGSHNWSNGALSRHHESSIYLESENLTSSFSEDFLDMWLESEKGNSPIVRRRVNPEAS